MSTYCSLKSPLEAGQLIEDTAQGPDVTLLVIRLAFTQLRRDVAWSAHYLWEGSQYYNLGKSGATAVP